VNLVVYDGYFTFGGTELINAERTKAYARNAMPLFGLTSECCDCPDLPLVAGDQDGYSSPMTDPAPWYSPFTPGSEEFYGLLPLSVEGIDDATVGASITELTTDGAVISRPRRSSRAMRFSGLLIGASDKGLDVGMAWLKSVLGGSECSAGDCGGDDLCYLATCPQVCSYEGFPTVLLDIERDQVTAQGWDLGPGTSFETVGSVGELTFTSQTADPSISWRMVDLVPGQVYRVFVAVSSYYEVPVTISVPGSTPGQYVVWPSVVESNSYYGPQAVPGDGGMGVFEFTAGAQVQRLVISGQVGDYVTLDRVRVERMAAASLALSTMPASGSPAEVQAWSYGSSQGASSTEYGKAVSRTSAFSGTLLGGNPWLSRRVTGLTPGRRYTLTAGVITRNQPTYLPNYTDRGVRMWTDTGHTTNAPVVWGATPAAVGNYVGWVQLTFQAVSRSHTVTIAPDRNMAMTTGSASIEVAYMRVEDDLVGVAITDPDPGLAERRHLRNVTAVSGPTVTGEFAVQVGAMRQVEFTLVAGDPRPLGDPRAVSTILGPGVSVVPQTECSMGEPVLTNHLRWGSFELVGSGPWNKVDSGPTSTFTSAVASSSAVAGSAVGRVQVTTSAYGTIRLQTSELSSTVGATYTASVYVRATHTITAVLGVLFPSFASLQGPKHSVLVPGGQGWRRLSITYTAPLSGTDLSVQFHHDPEAWPVGAQVDLDAFMVVDGARLGPYFDGSYPYSQWNGAPFNSTSEYRRTGSTLVVDPDCPPIPAPPRPPAITNDCIDVPTTWRRYTATIPAQVTAISPWSLPTVSITSGAVAVRGVRVRTVANPFGLAPEQLDPCSYCGEFIVTYLPPETTLTIDSAGRSATMTQPGQDPVSAMHLLYGSDGAPVVWPELSCGTQYVSIVDVDVDTPGALVGMDLSVTPAY
jgi:hypothetical protein